MKNKLVIYLFFSVSMATLIASLVLRYGQHSNLKESSSLRERKILKLTSVKIENRAIDIGKTPLGEQAKATFIIQNTGTESLYIDKIEVSCQCTSGEVSDEAIAPGDSVPITVQYNKNIVGYFFQDVLVYGNFETSPEILSFEGYLVKK